MVNEILVNDATSSLNGSIGPNDNVINLNSIFGFPSTGNFRIIIDSEIMLVTAVSGTTLTVTRGVDDSIAVVHSDGAIVDAILTKSSLQQFRADFNLMGIYSALPAPDTALVGRTFHCTDIPIKLRDNGFSWDAFGPIYNLIPPPALNTFTFVTQGSAIAINNGPFITYYDTGSATSVKKSLLTKSTPTQPYTLTIGFIPFVTASAGYTRVGIAFRNSGSDKYTINGISWREGTNKGGYLDVSYWSNITLQTQNYSTPHGYLGTPIFLRIKDDNTNRTYSISNDNLLWCQLYSESRTNNYTADQYGVVINTDSTTSKVGMTLLHWLEQQI
jgi:hypothetical protein